MNASHAAVAGLAAAPGGSLAGDRPPAARRAWGRCGSGTWA
jgi:hypothetical protein